MSMLSKLLKEFENVQNNHRERKHVRMDIFPRFKPDFNCRILKKQRNKGKSTNVTARSDVWRLQKTFTSFDGTKTEKTKIKKRQFTPQSRFLSLENRLQHSIKPNDHEKVQKVMRIVEPNSRDSWKMHSFIEFSEERKKIHANGNWLMRARAPNRDEFHELQINSNDEQRLHVDVNRFDWTKRTRSNEFRFRIHVDGLLTRVHHKIKPTRAIMVFSISYVTTATHNKLESPSTAIPVDE